MLTGMTRCRLTRSWPALALGAAALGAWLSGCETAPAVPAAHDVRRPAFDPIRYDRPADYLDADPHFADADRLRSLAAPLRRDDPEDTLRAIHSWIASHLRHDPAAAYAWRDLDRMLCDGTFGGCADHAVVFGSLARACGIPAVWVKTMDADWIRDAVARRSALTSYRGHVFLEIHIHDGWKLLDAYSMVLHDDYDPRARILPGNRWAYDKGGRPFDLVMSMRWEEWLAQTHAIFEDFDVSLLPVSSGRTVGGRSEGSPPGASPPVIITADRPVWQWLDERFQQLGFRQVFSTNAELEKYVPRARGGILVVTCVGGSVLLPPNLDDPYLAVPRDDLPALLRTSASGVARKRLEDGTLVLLVYGRDEEAIRAAISALTIER
jgi:hypothetical protein